MRVLLLDIGNTRAKAALWQCSAASLRDSVLPAGQMYALPAVPDASNLSVDAIWYASVASAERLDALKAQHGYGHIPWHWVQSEAEFIVAVSEHGTRFEPAARLLRNSYAEPGTLGIDRWLAMLGARQQAPTRSLLVIDAGTAITCDWVAADGQHLGGWIIPGMRLQQEAVLQRTARVLPARSVQPDLVAGTDTASCLSNGCLASAVAVCQLAIRQAPTSELFDVVFTGGDSAILVQHLVRLGELTALPTPAELAVDPAVDASALRETGCLANGARWWRDPLLVFRGMALYIQR
jgi:type III pantothenate kinase